MIKFLDLQSQYRSIKPEIDAAMAAVLNDAAFVGGTYSKNFEANFAKYQQADYCIGVGNGTDALEIALKALNFPANSEVLVPANSFFASAEAIVANDLIPVFCDCRKEDHTLDIEDAARRVTDKTVAIMPVHLYGHPCDMDAVVSLAATHNLKIIEDCAQAHGAEYKGRRVGAIGNVGCFSFYPGKNLGAYGDGGAIVTNDEMLSTQCRMIANHGRQGKYDHEFCGRNSRLDGLQSAVLDVKLGHLEEWTERRIAVANTYIEELAGTPEIELPKRQNWARQVYHLFVIRCANRDALKAALVDRGVQTGVHYPIALPRLEAFADHPQADESMWACEQEQLLLSLPIGDHMRPDDARTVAAALKDALGN